MGKTLVIFDVDGTLVYSNRIDSQCFAQTYEQIYRQTFPTIDWTMYPHVTDTVIFRTVIGQHFQRAVEPAEIGEFQRCYVGMLEANRASAPEAFPEVPAARAAIEKLLADERFTVGIATGGWWEPASVKLRHVSISTEKIHVAAADGKETREDIISHAMHLAAVQQGAPERVVYVGDAIWDVDTTRRMGLNFVGIRRSGDHHVLKTQGASHVLTDYMDYGRFLEAVLEASPPD